MPGVPIPQTTFPAEKCLVRSAKHLGRIPTSDGSGNGILLSDLIGKTPAQILSKFPHAGVNVTEATGLRSAQFKVMWPGYEHLDYTEAHEITGAWGQVGGLAILAASAINGFLQKAPRVKAHPSQYVITPDQKYSIHTLAIVSVVHIAGDVFQAEVQSVPRARRF